ncbi:hypothetical protein LLE95_10285, partial [Pediococcus acidilactici]|nr:hypothetical protein [Pediococcus acidilactici]
NDQSLLHKLASDLVPVQAIFSYEDIDGNRYNDLAINFFIGLKLYSDNEFKYISFFVTDKAPELTSDGTLVDDFIKYTTHQSLKNHSNHENQEESVKKESQ